MQSVLKAQVKPDDVFICVLSRHRNHETSATRDTRASSGSQNSRRFRLRKQKNRHAMSIVRQNFHEECEQALNKQINLELYASYAYLSMAYYFDRSDVALPGIYTYFKKCSDEEREHAMKFMTYLNKRGGDIHLTNIEKPSEDNWVSAKSAMMAALELEKRVNQSLLELHGLASTHNDPHLMDFLETEFLTEQVNAIKELADHVTNLERVAEGLGVYIFDKELGH